VNGAKGFEGRKQSEKPEAEDIAEGETFKGGGWASEAEGGGSLEFGHSFFFADPVFFQFVA
jgi:hypothetical protein